MSREHRPPRLVWANLGRVMPDYEQQREMLRAGDLVKQGQTIALVGRSGLTTGPHLDFRIKIGDQTVDPLQWLP